MPLFSKTKGRPGRFLFRLRVHELAPFPSRVGSVSIAWTRGSKKGALRAARGVVVVREQGLSKFSWNEDIQVECTLTQEQSAPGSNTFDKKWLILSIQDGQTSKIREPLGRVVINLSDYAGQEDPAAISFTVALAKSVSAEVPESKLIVSIEGHEAGKPSRNGKSAILDSSRASSEMSDEESRSPSISQSQRQGSLGRIEEDQPSHRATQYDEDGFIVDEPSQAKPPSKRPIQPSPNRQRANLQQEQRQAESDEDSEDEFLAQAVAHMEGKAPMPSIDQNSRRNTAEKPRQSSLDSPESRSVSQPYPPLNTRNNASTSPEAPFRPNRKPLFALKPEGTDDSPETPRFQQGNEGQSQAQSNPFTSRGSRQKLASDVILSQPSKSLRSPSSSLDNLERPVLKTRQLRPAPTSDRLSQDQASSASSSSEARTNPFIADKPSSRSALFQNEPRFPSSDRLVRKGSSRQSASLQSLNSGALFPDDSTSQQAQAKPNSGDRRSLEVILPTAVAVRKKPIVSVPSDHIQASDSPIKASAPGRHWLDEPEDLGVEASPPDSPVKVTKPAFQNAAPIFSMPEVSRPGKVDAGTFQAQTIPLKEKGHVGSSVPLKQDPPPAQNPFTNRPQVTSVEVPHSFEQLDSPFDRPRSPTKRTLRSDPTTAAEPIQTNPFLPPVKLEESPTISGTISRQPERNIPPERMNPPSFPLQSEPLQKPRVESPTKGRAQISEQPEKPKPSQALIQNQIIQPPIPTAKEPPKAAVAASNPFTVGSMSRNEPNNTFVPAKKVINLDDEVSPTNRQAFSALDGQNNAETSTSGQDFGDEDEHHSTFLLQELRAVAALEASVYLARGLKHRRHSISARKQMINAPARRLARTIISLGQEEGTIFGLRALRAIDSAAESATDIPGQAYWWSNCIQLRWMLWAVCHGGQLDPEPEDEDSDEFEWVMQVVVPPLRELEAEIFQQLFQYMWSCVLMEGITADQIPGYSQKKWAMQPNPQEEAVERWIDALQTAHRALLPASNAVSSGHVNLLKHKILTALMRRLDSTLFEILVEGDSNSRSVPMASRMIHQQWEGRKASGLGRELKLGPELLPFERAGPLSFTLGVTLKMAATAWTTWASDIGLRNDSGSPEEGSMLFPKLRATADLLMMKKELLTDRAIRNEMLPGLALPQICELLTRFRPDENDRQPLPPGLMEALYNETPTAEQPDSPTAQGRAGYEPPSEAALMASGLVSGRDNLEFNDDSEDDLEALTEMFDPEQQGHNIERFQLLRELWAKAR